MAVKVLRWLVLEALVNTQQVYSSMCSNNVATLAGQMWGASKRSAIVNWLLRILTIPMRATPASLLVTRYLVEKQNLLGDVPSRLFGWAPEWNFTNDNDFLTFFNACLPLTCQDYWTGFCLTNKISLKVTSKLLTLAPPMAKWRQLLTLGRKFGRNGKPIVKPLELIHTWMESLSKPLPGLAPDLAGGSEENNGTGPLALEVFAPTLGASTHWLPWTWMNNPSNNKIGAFHKTSPAHADRSCQCLPSCGKEVVSWSRHTDIYCELGIHEGQDRTAASSGRFDHHSILLSPPHQWVHSKN